MGLDDSANPVQLSGLEAVIAGKPKRLEPVLARPVLALHMNVRRFIESKLVKKNRYGPGMPVTRGMWKRGLPKPPCRS
jgi:hypothetical protein